MKRNFKIFGLAIYGMICLTVGFYINAAIQIKEVLGLPQETSVSRTDDSGWVEKCIWNCDENE